MLEIRGAAPGLLDDPLLLEVGGAAPSSTLLWRTRIRDDDGFVWRGEGPSLDALSWSAKSGEQANLRSLRPVELEVRVEGGDGAATRTLTRRVLADGVKLRRWKDGVVGRLLLPAEPAATVVVAGGDDNTIISAALLASRGVRVFAIASGDPSALPFDDARRLDALPLPPGLPARQAPDAGAWDALLAELGATPRRVAR